MLFMHNNIYLPLTSLLKILNGSRASVLPEKKSWNLWNISEIFHEISHEIFHAKKMKLYITNHGTAVARVHPVDFDENRTAPRGAADLLTFDRLFQNQMWMIMLYSQQLQTNENVAKKEI